MWSRFKDFDAKKFSTELSLIKSGLRTNLKKRGQSRTTNEKRKHLLNLIYDVLVCFITMSFSVLGYVTSCFKKFDDKKISHEINLIRGEIRKALRKKTGTVGACMRNSILPVVGYCMLPVVSCYCMLPAVSCCMLPVVSYCMLHVVSYCVLSVVSYCMLLVRPIAFFLYFMW